MCSPSQVPLKSCAISATACSFGSPQVIFHLREKEGQGLTAGPLMGAELSAVIQRLRFCHATAVGKLQFFSVIRAAQSM